MLIGWLTEVESERAAAEAQLGLEVPKEPLSEKQVRILVGQLKDTLRFSRPRRRRKPPSTTIWASP